jgi:hypothetical protein
LSERQHKDEKSAVTALREIEEGLYTRDHFDGKIKNAEQLAKEAQEKEELEDEHQFTQSERTPE